MNQTIIEIKLELVITSSGDLNVEVRRIGSGVRKRIKTDGSGRSRSDDALVSFSSSNGDYSYSEVPLHLSILGKPLADYVETQPSGKSTGGEVIDDSNR